MADITLGELSFVCDEPSCDLARGAVGLTSEEIRARVIALKARPAPAEDPDELDDAEADEDSEEDADAADPADPTSIDPVGAGAPCPLCLAADPPRGGKLLAVPTAGSYGRMIAARLGSFGLLFWLRVESDSRTGTNRLLDAQRHVQGNAATSKATTSFVVGQKTITAVVLKELPFDGHLLHYGNKDADQYGTIEVPGQGKKKPYKKKGWYKAAPQYGPTQAPPGPAARENPMYIRELQEDLIWLGYFSTSRGSPQVGVFDVYTLGAVLGFKQDLIDVYGIGVSPTALPVAPGSVRAGQFTTAIWSQDGFISPVRIVLDWRKTIVGGKEQPGVKSTLQALVARLSPKKPPTKSKERHAAHGVVNEKLAALESFVAHWPRLAPLEQVTKPFLPFAPKTASKTVDQLAPAPKDKQPKHADVEALIADPVWSSAEYNARAKNREYFTADLRELLAGLGASLADIEASRQGLTTYTPPPELAAEWATTRVSATRTLDRLEKLLGLVRFWTLDMPTQMIAWLAHIRDMGTVDQPTAVYLKALREGGKIGPNRRPAYQLQALTLADDFTRPDGGAIYLRGECTGRKPNKSGKDATTIPEIIALQFFGNESGLKFTHGLAPFNTRTEDKNKRLPLLGIDTNAHRKGSFDAVFHAGGEWYWSRGWGVGQATDRDGELDGVALRRGLPIMPADADNVHQPKPYIDREESVKDAMARKILAKYNARTDKRDCTFGKSGYGAYYDCHRCLKRFVDDGLVGSGEYGKGGVFVPKAKGSIGSVKKASSFFVDLERYTPFARGDAGVEDPLAAVRFKNFFATELPETDPNVAVVLRSLKGKQTLAGAVKHTAKAAGLMPKTLMAAVHAHVDARSQFPCSWLQVRIQYAGSGEQAFGSLMDLFKVVGALDTKNETMIKHIKEASELRRNA